MSVMALITYFVEGMRVRKPGTKAQEANPDRWVTVSGTFHSTKVEDGHFVATDELTIVSKDVTFDMARDAGFALDLANGFLTIPAGDRGRKPSEALSEDTILAELAALRTPDPVPDPVPEPETSPEAEGKRSK